MAQNILGMQCWLCVLGLTTSNQKYAYGECEGSHALDSRREQAHMPYGLLAVYISSTPRSVSGSFKPYSFMFFEIIW
jgi:hypothetical protein